MRLAAERKEEWVKKEIKKILNSHGKHIKYFMPSASMYGKAGAHDFICCVKGHMVTIEAKKGHNKPTDLQIDFANDIQLAGGSSYCINEYNLEELRRVIDCIVNYPGYAQGSGHNFERFRT